MNNSNKTPIATITVLCNPKTVKRIALTCKNLHRWTELIPQEVHDSALLCRLECPTCGAAYILQNHQFTREEDFVYGGQQENGTDGTTGFRKFRFDA